MHPCLSFIHFITTEEKKKTWGEMNRGRTLYRGSCIIYIYIIRRFSDMVYSGLFFIYSFISFYLQFIYQHLFISLLFTCGQLCMCYLAASLPLGRFCRLLGAACIAVHPLHDAASTISGFIILSTSSQGGRAGGRWGGKGIPKATLPSPSSVPLPSLSPPSTLLLHPWPFPPPCQ